MPTGVEQGWNTVTVSILVTSPVLVVVYVVLSVPDVYVVVTGGGCGPFVTVEEGVEPVPVGPTGGGITPLPVGPTGGRPVPDGEWCGEVP